MPPISREAKILARIARNKGFEQAILDFSKTKGHTFIPHGSAASEQQLANLVATSPSAADKVFSQFAQAAGATVVQANRAPTEIQLVDLAKRYGSNAEKALTSGGIISKESPFKQVGKGLLFGGGLVAGGVAVDKGINAVSNKMQDLFQDRAFDEMLKLHPKLQLEDAERVRLFFNTLWTFAPDMAKDPLVAGTAVYQAMKMDIYGGYPVEAIKTVVEIQNKKSDTHGGSPLGRNLSDFLSNSGKQQVIGIYH